MCRTGLAAFVFLFILQLRFEKQHVLMTEEFFEQCLFLPQFGDIYAKLNRTAEVVSGSRNNLLSCAGGRRFLSVGEHFYFAGCFSKQENKHSEQIAPN